MVFGRIREWLHDVFDRALLVAEDDRARCEFDRLGSCPKPSGRRRPAGLEQA